MFISGDPIDNRYVVLKDSERFPLAGEGMVAKVDIPKGTIFCHMSGYILNNAQFEDLEKNITNYKKEKNLKPGEITECFLQTFEKFTKWCIPRQSKASYCAILSWLDYERIIGYFIYGK